MSAQLSGLRNKKALIPLILVLAGLLLVAYKPLSTKFASAKLDLVIQRPPVIMPAVYKVYANENAMDGKYSLFKMLVTNNSSNDATNVEVAYEIPNFIEKKVFVKFPKILAGQSVVVNCFPTFPDKIVEKNTTSKETVNIYVTGSNISSTDETFNIDIKGKNEFIYSNIPADEIRTAGEYFDNMPLLSCYVTPEDPIIKYYTQKIQEKVLKGETASVTNKEEEGVRFLTGIYYATLVSHMVYSGTSGVPAKIDDVSSLVQSIRLPREVVTGKTGLCIELTLLYASILMNAGLDPIIFLIPGHAYPGFRMNGKYYALESTGIGGEGTGSIMSTQQALETGMKNLNTFFQQMAAGDDRYRIVDVRESISKGAVAMELRDDSYLRGQVDEITKVFDAGYKAPPQPVANANPNNGGGNGGGGNGGGNGGGGNAGGTPNGYKAYNGTVNFAYPASWRPIGKNAQSMPQLKQLIANSNNSAYVEVYQFNGYQNGQQAIQAIQQFVGNFGANLQYQAHGRSANGYDVFNGVTTYGQNSIAWVAAFKSTGNGVSGIAVGANGTTGNKYTSTITNIINTLQ